MNLDFKKAFNSPFSEEKWYLKLVFPFTLLIIGVCLDLTIKALNLLNQMHMSHKLLIIYLIQTLLLLGFYAQFGHNEVHDEIPLLPELKPNFIKFFKHGFLFLVIMAVYLSLLIIGGPMFFLGFLGAPDIVLRGLILMLIGIFIGFPLSIFAEGSFFDNFSFKEAFNIKRLLKLLLKVKKETFFYLLMVIFSMFITNICNWLILISRLNIIFTILSIVFSVAILMIFQLTIINLNAQLYKIAKSRAEQ